MKNQKITPEMLAKIIAQITSGEPVDLLKCHHGDILISKHGVILTYEEYLPRLTYPHQVRYPDNSQGSRTDDGHVFKFKRLPSDEDIVAVIYV